MGNLLGHVLSKNPVLLCSSRPADVGAHQRTSSDVLLSLHGVNDLMEDDVPQVWPVDATGRYPDDVVAHPSRS